MKNELRHPFDILPGLVWTALPDGQIDFLNQRWCEYTGLSVDEARGRGWQTAINPNDLPELLAQWPFTLASAGPREVDARLRRFDGEYHWFLFRCCPLADASGQVIKWYGIATDIDDRKRAEKSLRGRDGDFRSIADTIPALIALMTPTGAVESVNRHALDYYGVTIEDLQSWAVTDTVHPDDLPAVIAAWMQSVDTGQPYDIEHRIRRADGVYRWFHVSGHPLRDVEGHVVRWCVLQSDIDDRKRAEGALRASEHNLIQIINAIPALAWSARPDGSAEFFNQHYLDYVGLSAEQAKGWGWTAAVHPDDLNGLIGAWQLMMAADEPGECEGRLRRFDGEYRWFLFRTNPFHDESGKTVKWYGINTDIDDRKRAEEELKRSEAFLVEAQKLSMTGSFRWSVSTDDHFWSAETFRIFEYEPSTKVTVQLVVDRVHPEDADIIRQRMARVDKGEDFDYECRFIMPSGTVKHLHIVAHGTRNQDGQLEYIGAVQDVTERRLAEEQLRKSDLHLRQTTETIPEMLWSATPEGAIDYCNARVLDYTGFSADRITGNGWKDLLHPDDVEQAAREWISCVATGAPYRVEVRTFHAADRTYRWCVTTALPLRDEQGRILKWHGTIVDMHDWKQAQEELRQTQMELAHMMRVMTMGELTASIAHEVNQPLAGIITNASTCLRMLASDPPNIDGARETARRTIRDGNRASDVITKLRALFGKQDAATESVDLNAATREVIALSMRDVQRNEVILRTELASDLPPVMGDRVQLQQVILNLLLNASDAMSGVDDRPRRLVIRTERTEGESVRLIVRDTGVGVDPQNMDQLFSPFYTTKSGGMGIGLSISRSIIESHRGRLWATPNDGPGASFSFCIPTSPEGATDTHNPGSMLKFAKPGAAKVKRKSC